MFWGVEPAADAGRVGEWEEEQVVVFLIGSNNIFQPNFLCKHTRFLLLFWRYLLGLERVGS